MNFSNYPLSPFMLENLDSLGYLTMTPIQEESLPHILEKKDILAQAQTGSGKTAAFGIGILHHLDVKKFRIQSLVLCPTRELADQVSKELRKLARFAHNIKILTLTGGESFGKQLGSLAHNAHIVVGTPGRVLKHLNKGSLELTNLQTLVLDEADRMLDMGFLEEVDAIIEYAPKTRQTLLFSATFEQETLEVSSKIQNDALHIKVEPLEQKVNIEEIFVQTDEKENTLKKLLAHYKPENVIVFVNTKIEADRLAKTLQQKEIDALALHGDLEQYERNDVLVQFANGSCPIIVATDVAARGLDIKELAMVVNYDLANTPEIHTHRIGRTGRAGASGIALSLYDTDESIELLRKESSTLMDADALELAEGFTMPPKNVTIVIEGGKKDKLRAGDILGALTGKDGIAGSSVGKIDIYDRQAYVAIASQDIDKAITHLKKNKIKNKNFSIWAL